MTDTSFDFAELYLAAPYTAGALTLSAYAKDNTYQLKDQKTDTLINELYLVGIDSGDATKKMGIKILGVVQETELFQGNTLYTLTIATSDAGNPMVGLANTYDNTLADANIIAGNKLASLPQDSLLLVTVNAGLIRSIKAGQTSTSNTGTATADGDVAAGKGGYLQSDGTGKQGTNAGKFDFVALTTAADGESFTYARYVASGITVPGDVGDTIYVESDGDLTTTATGNVRIGRKQEATTLVIFNVDSTSSFSDDAFEIYDDGDSTKKVQIDASGITTGNTRTIEIPDSDGKILTDSEAAVPDSVLEIVGSVDATKKVKFEVDGLTTATTRTLTAQDKDYTIADDDDVAFKTGAKASGTANASINASGKVVSITPTITGANLANVVSVTAPGAVMVSGQTIRIIRGRDSIGNDFYTDASFNGSVVSFANTGYGGSIAATAVLIDVAYFN